MTIRWTQPANDDFLEIVEWIAAHNPSVAASAGRRILATVEQLAEFPFRGKPGRSPDTRELVISGLPYLVVYGIEADSPRLLSFCECCTELYYGLRSRINSGYTFCKAQPIDVFETQVTCKDFHFCILQTVNQSN